jgi:integrase
MAAKRPKKDPFKRISTRYRGISFRERADGTRSYYVSINDRHQLVEGGEREALLLQADVRAKQGRGMRVTPLDVTFGELAEEWFKARKSSWRPSTQNGYRTALDSHLLPVFGKLRLTAITPDDVARFVAQRQAAGASGAYVAGNLRPLNGVLKLALRRGLITANPVVALLPEERPKVKKRKRRAWTPNEIKRLLAAARELGSRVGNIFDYTPIITVAIYTGLRLGELLGLRWQDVDLENGVIHVRHQLCRETRTLVAPKTDAGVRDVPIPASLVRYLRPFRLESKYSQGDHFVFCSRKGTPLEHRNVAQRGFEAAAEHEGLNRPGEDKLTTHDLRHAFASVIAHHGFAAVDLAVFMGHTDSRVTQETYIHPYDEAATAARFREVLDAAMADQALDSG